MRRARWAFASLLCGVLALGCGPDGPEQERKRDPSATDEGDCDVERGDECETVVGPYGDDEYGEYGGGEDPYVGDDAPGQDAEPR
jgi:hypothetical protein